MSYINNKTKNRRRYRTRYKNSHNYRSKRTRSQTRSAVIVSVVTFLIIAALILVVTFGDSIYAWLEGTLNPIGAKSTVDETAPSQAVTQSATTAPTQPPTQMPQIVQDAEFLELLRASGNTVDKLSGSQMIFVKSSGTQCTVSCYEKDEDGLWTSSLDSYSGYIGSQGLSDSTAPYDTKTPKGTYSIKSAFGTNYDPGTKLEYTQVGTQSRWITDPSSQYYNQFVEGTDNQDWNDSQWLYEYTVSYPYAVVFDYNTDPVDNTKGCAKFLHVSSVATNGGIGIGENELLSILYWLDPAKSPTISIF